MFSGIVSAVGTIQHIFTQTDTIDFVIFIPTTWTDLTIGESIAVNGVCLTVTAFTQTTIHVTAVPETLRVTNLGQLAENNLVNLERSITINTRLGGHYVQGHVDAVGDILDIQADGDTALLATISMPEILGKYIVRKGYITLDGMSITVIDVAKHYFTVTFIPHTQQVTIVNHYRTGQKINIEVDMMGKYIEKLMMPMLLNKIKF